MIVVMPDAQWTLCKFAWLLWCHTLVQHSVKLYDCCGVRHSSNATWICMIFVVPDAHRRAVGAGAGEGGAGLQGHGVTAQWSAGHSAHHCRFRHLHTATAVCCRLQQWWYWCECALPLLIWKKKNEIRIQWPELAFWDKFRFCNLLKLLSCLMATNIIFTLRVTDVLVIVLVYTTDYKYGVYICVCCVWYSVCVWESWGWRGEWESLHTCHFVSDNLLLPCYC